MSTVAYAATGELGEDRLVYPRERLLGAVTLIIGIVFWLALLVGTFGTILIGLAVGAVAYLFVHSALIAHLKGNGVELSEAQLPELYAEFTACCHRLQVDPSPKAYVLNGNGVLNAFATKFLRTQYVVLNSGVVDAMQGNADGLRFYIGHELGHLRMKHLRGQFFRWPVLWLPLLGAAYSRARETTCDLHGLACSGSGAAAVRALSVLAAGPARWKNLDLPAYIRQTEHSRGFWMSFHELVSGYPWLTKRAARVAGEDASVPARNPFAYLLAIFVPYGGRLGGGITFLLMVYLVGVLAAIAIPAYQDYTVRAKLAIATVESRPAREKLARYYLANHRTPDSLEAAGVPARLADGSPLTLDSKRMVLTVETARGELLFVPSADARGRIVWSCANGKGLRAAQLPASCRSGASR